MLPQDFDRLEKLLSLKRHEAPPPGYFDTLPNQIRNRLQREIESGRQPSWWQNLLENFSPKYILATAYSGMVALLFLAGLGLSSYSDQTPGYLAPNSGAWLANASPAHSEHSTEWPTLNFASYSPSNSVPSSINPIPASPPDFLFQPSLSVDRVGFFHE